MFQKTIVYALVIFTFVYANPNKYIYDVESAIIEYEITGGAVFTPETNLSIKGTAALRFKEWGKTKIDREDGFLLLTGAIEHKESVRHFIKQTNDNIVTVDYLNEQLIEGKTTSKDTKDNEIKNFKLVRKEIVAGYECEVWKANAIEKCLYKGVVLKLESNIYNVYYIKKATSVVFDTNSSEIDFDLPDYPKHKIGLLKEYKRVQKIHTSHELSHSIEKNTSEEESKTNFLNHLGEDIYAQQKKILPKSLLMMKKTRECLQGLDNPFEDNVCMGNFSDMTLHLGTNKYKYLSLWNEKNKEKLLDNIENDVLALQSKVPCIKRAKNIIDLSMCMKDR